MGWEDGDEGSKDIDVCGCEQAGDAEEGRQAVKGARGAEAVSIRVAGGVVSEWAKW